MSLSEYELYRLTEYINLIVKNLRNRNKNKNTQVIDLCLRLGDKLNKRKKYFSYLNTIMLDFESKVSSNKYLYELYFKKIKNYIEIVHELRNVYFDKGQI